MIAGFFASRSRNGPTVYNGHLRGPTVYNGHLRGPTVYNGHLRGPTVYNVHLRGPVTLTPNAERSAVELSLPVFNDLCLSRPEFEHPTALPQSLKVEYIC